MRSRVVWHRGLLHFSRQFAQVVHPHVVGFHVRGSTCEPVRLEELLAFLVDERALEETSSAQRLFEKII